MSPIKHDIRHFHVVVVQKRKRNVQKVSCTCKVVVSPMTPIAFMKFSLPSPSSDLKVPIKRLGRAFTYVLYLYYELQLSFFLVFPISHIFSHPWLHCLGTWGKKMLLMGCSYWFLFKLRPICVPALVISLPCALWIHQVAYDFFKCPCRFE